MSKKRKLRYPGKFGKKYGKKLAKFYHDTLTKVEETVEIVVEKAEKTLDKTQQFIDSVKEKEAKLIQVEDPAVEEKPKTTRKAKPRTTTKKKATTSTAKKTTSTTRRKRTTKTTTDSQVICRKLELVIMINYNLRGPL